MTNKNKFYIDKNTKYYKELDLRLLAEQWRHTEKRRDSEFYHDLRNALVKRCDSEVFTAADLLYLLGEPDFRRTMPGDESKMLWEYHWYGYHGPDKYYSCTPFTIGNGIIIGTYHGPDWRINVHNPDEDTNL
jgi:hypothetical protein